MEKIRRREINYWNEKYTNEKNAKTNHLNQQNEIGYMYLCVDEPKGEEEKDY